MPRGAIIAPLNRRTELIGQKIGKLTILGPGPIRGNVRRSFWLCQCDCGKQVNARETNLLHNKILSCGCLVGQHIKQADGTLKLNRDAWGKAAIWRYYQYGQSAKQRGYSFNIPEELFHTISRKACYYCGAEPSNTARVPERLKGTRRSQPYLYNGLDRINNDRGYELDNVVTCCSDCNRAKRCLTQEAFFSLIARIHERHCLKDAA